MIPTSQLGAVKIMKFLTYLLVLGLFFPAISLVAVEPPADGDFVRDSEHYFSRLERLGFAGAVLVAQDGDTLLAHGYGLADREKQTRWTPETVSTVGSITKQFTAAAILALGEDGKLAVEDSIGKYLPGVPPDKAGITIHHLLTHTSGLADDFPYGDFDPVDRDQIVKLAMEAPLVSPPGERYRYSNVGYSLLGVIVERRSGTSYEEYLRTRLFSRADMTETGYRRPSWDPARLAQGYQGDERWGTILERPWASDGPYWMLRANGGIHSTGLDMLRWARALLDDRVLTRASRDKLWTPFADEGGGDSYYGYGWVVRPGPDGKPVVTHNGGNGVFFADFAILPERRTVLYLATNVVADFPGAQRILEDLEFRLLAGAPFPEVPEVLTVGADSLRTFAGIYALPGGAKVIVERGPGRLRLTARGPDAWFHLYATGADSVTYRARQALLERVVAGFLSGDYRPLQEAYGGSIPLEELERRGKAALAELEADIGPIGKHEILGSAPLEEGAATYVRLTGPRGTRDRQYVWTKDGALRGYRPLEEVRPLSFFMVGKDRFRAWDGSLAVATAAAFERDEKGARVLVLGEGGDAVRLRPYRGR